MAQDKQKASIKEWPEDERPREKASKHGIASLSKSELLAKALCDDSGVIVVPDEVERFRIVPDGDQKFGFHPGGGVPACPEKVGVPRSAGSFFCRRPGKKKQQRRKKKVFH